MSRLKTPHRMSLCTPLKHLPEKEKGKTWARLNCHAVSISPLNVEQLVMKPARPSVISMLSPGSHSIHNVFMLLQTVHGVARRHPPEVRTDSGRNNQTARKRGHQNILFGQMTKWK